jgi:hypothetical protein
VYNVQQHRRYRIRLINAAFNVCPFQLQIENHNFTITESDGGSIEPIVVDTLYFLPGERYDIVVSAVHEVRDYWIRISTLFPCIRTNTVEGFAVLRYREASGVIKSLVTAEFVERNPPAWSESYEIGKLFNAAVPSGSGIPISAAKSSGVGREIFEAKADHLFYLVFDSPVLDNEELFTSHKTIKFMG